MSTRSRLLLKGGRVLTMDPALGDFDRADILIENEGIREVAPSIEAEDCEVIDASGSIVTPGFIDTHRHVWQTQLRTVATDWSLFDYTVQMRFIYGSFYSPEDAYLGNRVGALEALNAGITTLVDHSHIMNSPDHADEAVRGLKEAGIRGIFCYGFFPNPERGSQSFSWDPKWRFEDARRVRQQHFPSDDGLLTLGLAPMEVTATPFEVTCSEIRFAREIGARRVSCHVSMGRWDRGERIVQRLGEAGLLAEDLLFVHGSSLTDRELDLIAESGVGISATPETELQMGMGQPVAVRALGRSVRTSLGIDIVSNFSGDMQAQMRVLLQSQRGFENADLTAPPREIRFKAREVLELATIGGARVAGLDSVTGSLTPGKQADLVLMRCDRINMVPVIDPVGAVVLNANVHDVDTVLVAGRVVKRRGELLGADWASLADRLRRSSERIVAGFRTVPLKEVEKLIAPLMLSQP